MSCLWSIRVQTPKIFGQFVCLFFYNNIDSFWCPFPMKKEKNKLQYHHISCYSLLFQNIALDQSTFWETCSVVVNDAFFSLTHCLQPAYGKQSPCEFHWKAILSFSTPFQFELRGWAKGNYWDYKNMLTDKPLPASLIVFYTYKNLWGNITYT